MDGTCDADADGGSITCDACVDGVDGVDGRMACDGDAGIACVDVRAGDGGRRVPGVCGYASATGARDVCVMGGNDRVVACVGVDVSFHR